MKSPSDPKKFLATIYKIWMMRYVDVPEDVGLALARESAGGSGGKRGKALPKHIPVIATSNGRSTRTTLVPGGAGRYRLQVNATLRRAARADVGEVIGVALKLDLASRELPVPSELVNALKTRPRLKKEFDGMTVAGRRQFVRYCSAKSPDVRQKRLARALEVLLERAVMRRPEARSGRQGK